MSSVSNLPHNPKTTLLLISKLEKPNITNPKNKQFKKREIQPVRPLKTFKYGIKS